MLILLGLASIAQTSPLKLAAVGSTASIRILQGARSTENDWKSAPRNKQREYMIKDDQGRPTLIRLIEHE